MKNDPVFFLDELTKVFARHPNWTMPKDQLNGTAPASPQRDGLSDMRVAVFMRLLPDSSMVNYFWKVLSETDAIGICRRIVGMVAPHDTDKFEAPLYDVQAQWESLRAFPVNTGQLLDRTMELRGRKACDTCEAATSATRRYLPQRKPGARKPRFLRLAARQVDGPRGMRAACGTSLGSGTCVVDTNKTRKGVRTIRPEGGRRNRSRSDVCRMGSLLRGEKPSTDEQEPEELEDRRFRRGLWS